MAKKTLVFTPPLLTSKVNLFIELFGGKNGQTYFRIKSANGRLVAQSEGYHKPAMALKTAKKFNLKIYEI